MVLAVHGQVLDKTDHSAQVPRPRRILHWHTCRMTWRSVWHTAASDCPAVWLSGHSVRPALHLPAQPGRQLQPVSFVPWLYMWWGAGQLPDFMPSTKHPQQVGCKLGYVQRLLPRAVKTGSCPTPLIYGDHGALVHNHTLATKACKSPCSLVVCEVCVEHSEA